MTWILNIFPKYIVIIHATDKTYIFRKLAEIMVNFLLLVVIKLFIINNFIGAINYIKSSTTHAIAGPKGCGHGRSSVCHIKNVARTKI